MNKYATIEVLKGQGVETFALPIIHETTSGLVCRTGPNDSPATEHFAFKSARCTIISHKGRHSERPHHGVRIPQA